MPFFYVETELDLRTTGWSGPSGAIHASPIFATDPEAARSKYNSSLRKLIGEKTGVHPGLVQLQRMMIETKMKQITLFSFIQTYRGRNAFIFFPLNEDD